MTMTTHRPGADDPDATREIPQYRPQTDKPQTYTPEGAVLEQLRLANTLVGIAIFLAGGCIVAAKMFEMHPLGRLYGLLWVLIALASMAGFATKDVYPTEDDVWKLCNYKFILAVVSFVLSMAVWLIPILAY
jgi:hypothetical protein